MSVKASDIAARREKKGLTSTEARKGNRKPGAQAWVPVAPLTAPTRAHAHTTLDPMYLRQQGFSL